jgi:hypothetical protein
MRLTFYGADQYFQHNHCSVCPTHNPPPPHIKKKVVSVDAYRAESVGSRWSSQVTADVLVHSSKNLLHVNLLALRIWKGLLGFWKNWWPPLYRHARAFYSAAGEPNIAVDHQQFEHRPDKQHQRYALTDMIDIVISGSGSTVPVQISGEHEQGHRLIIPQIHSSDLQECKTLWWSIRVFHSQSP